MIKISINVTIPTTFSKPRTVKDAIISILSKEWPLTARKIYSNVKGIGLNVSYQSVHKNLNCLIDEEIVERYNKKYRIDKNWLREIKKFAEMTEISYDNEKTSLISQNSHEFDNYYEYLLFIIKFLAELSESGKRTGYANIRHLNWPFNMSPQEYGLVKKMFDSYDKIYLLCRNNTFADKAILKFYGRMTKNLSVKLGEDCAHDFDIYVVGDTVTYVYFDDKTQFSIDKAFGELKSSVHSSFGKIFEDLFKKPNKVKIVYFKNPAVAQEIRERTLRCFRK